ncbi:hypothetical protein BV22DRAFT_1134543 [Leucogyrophana mollusca]|uniref:Uncharacterized protein n=1 Tax=Leucogyrophana mollusca TaxID=85980 RepID=A0ACB8B060_9AGAM|nr:hypothetical protein BV22DRAFT_1134543 [Leucogyrophana mollusca]
MTNYFIKARELLACEPGLVPRPFQSFTAKSTTFNIAQDPSYTHMLVHDVAAKYLLPDLPAALGDYLIREETRTAHTVAGQHHSPNTCVLPFTHLQLWTNMHLQQMSFHDPDSITRAQNINALPPSSTWPYGRFDPVVVNVDRNHQWPKSGMEVRLIMCPILVWGQRRRWMDRFLVYVQRFNIIPQSGSTRDPVTGLHILRRAQRSNGTPMGDIIPLSQLRAAVNVIPRFGKTANKRLTHSDSQALLKEFWLNKYWEKDLYHALSL